MSEALSPEQKAVLAIVAELKRQERAQVRPSVIGVLGLGLLGLVGYLAWRRR